MKKETANMGKKLSLIALIMVVVVAIMHIVINVVSINNHVTSFPWYSAILFTGIYYIIPIVALIVLVLVFSIKLKK